MKTKLCSITGLLIVGIIFMQSCRKESPTVVNGTVVDEYTQKPLSNVSIEIEKWMEDKRGYFYFATIQTDGEGKFTFGDEFTPKFIIRELRCAGYLIKNKGIYSTFVDFEANKINNVKIPMIPTDGELHLILENLNAQFDTIYVGIYSPSLDYENGFSDGIVSIEAFTIPVGASHIKDVKLASNESVIIYWSFSPSTILFSTACLSPSNTRTNL